MVTHNLGQAKRLADDIVFVDTRSHHRTHAGR
jgi:ABC-type phosphate transport system ATPase subunit